MSAQAISNQAARKQATPERAARKQPFGIGVRQHELAKTLKRHQREDDGRETHATRRSATQLANPPRGYGGSAGSRSRRRESRRRR